LAILDRYVAREFFKIFAICVAGFIMVFLLVELTDKLKYYFKCRPSSWLMVKYFLVKSPGYLFYAVPLSVLLAGMLTLFILARNSEIIAMQANGVDALSIARPVLWIGFGMSLLMFVSNETVIPWSNWRSQEIQDYEICPNSERAYIKRDQIWMRSPTGITHIGKFTEDKPALEKITIIRWDRSFHFRERIYADKAKWWRDHWILAGVNRAYPNPSGGFVRKVIPTMNGAGLLNKTPSDFRQVERLTIWMNLTQLSAYIDKLKEEGKPVTKYLVDWHDKIAFPFVCLIMAALGVPFAIKAGPRSSGVAYGLAISVGIAFAYWVVHTLSLGLGHGGYLPPIVAAWSPTALFGLFAMIMLLKAGI
jgi:lipopolysaccharide export system permease protein